MANTTEALNTMANQLKTLAQKQAQELEQQNKQLQQEKTALEKEKQYMKKFQVSDDDIVDINVGGKGFSTTRSNLCRFPGSKLEAMFSGRWNMKLDKKKKGIY